ncbi:hypothetical protein BDN72DRAFT_193858 [Pluteus cervinus]|uniref:Uncharacterized protein n=1 Tax=Pluteus cervinus TaxID=181527 RepID=A0ACD3AIY1_9AGAR|nr:hypothetical protein BDN72DRAFT_193858 [Pluteus cervinus]
MPDPLFPAGSALMAPPQDPTTNRSVMVRFKLNTLISEYAVTLNEAMETAFSFALTKFIEDINEKNTPSISRVYQQYKLSPASGTSSNLCISKPIDLLAVVAHETYERSRLSPVSTLFSNDNPTSNPIIEVFEDPRKYHKHPGALFIGKLDLRQRASAASAQDLNLTLSKVLQTALAQKAKRDEEYDQLTDKYRVLLSETERVSLFTYSKSRHFIE